MSEVKGIPTYYVLAASICPRCGGEQFVLHSAWDAYWAAHPGNTANEDEVRRWFAEKGYGEPPENEEIVCPVCGGSGMSVQLVPLGEAIREEGLGITSIALSWLGVNEEEEE